MPKISPLSNVFQLQAEAVLNQAGAVQNTWYTILDTTLNARIVRLNVACTVANETVQVRLTVDGQTITSNDALTAGTTYNIVWVENAAAGTVNLTVTTTAATMSTSFLIEGRSIKIEIRKTTAAGASALLAKAIYGKM